MAGHSFHFITKRDNKLTFHYYFPLSILAIWDYFNCINKHLETKSEFGCVLIRLILYSFGAINVFCISMAIDRISFRTEKFTGVSLEKKTKNCQAVCDLILVGNPQDKWMGQQKEWCYNSGDCVHTREMPGQTPKGSLRWHILCKTQNKVGHGKCLLCRVIRVE